MFGTGAGACWTGCDRTDDVGGSEVGGWGCGARRAAKEEMKEKRKRIGREQH